MNRSEAINELATALAKAQANVQGAKRDATNPFFEKSASKGKYADLSSVWEACRAALTDNGLSVVQAARSLEAGVEVETMLMHTSGQWISETLALPVSKADAQGFGSALTYCRRYGLSAMVGVAPEDDDGNAAVVAKPAAEDFKPTRGVEVKPTAGIENAMPLHMQVKVKNLAAHVEKHKANSEQLLTEYRAAKDELEGDADAQAFLWKSIDAKVRKQIQQYGMSLKQPPQGGSDEEPTRQTTNDKQLGDTAGAPSFKDALAALKRKDFDGANDIARSLLDPKERAAIEEEVQTARAT